ncbi:Uncharacterised protein [uncultured archaeon]|nr:Uncharacterised protein [uncultured archaeon]
MPAPPEVEQAFASTFKLIFGECNRPLDFYGDYLLSAHHPAFQQSSCISGKPIALSSDRYAKDERFVSQDEIGALPKAAALDINQIKDVDSIVQALSERAYYTGNKRFGSSEYIAESDNCLDSFHVWRSHTVQASKYVAYSSYVRENSEHVFGGTTMLRSKFLIRCLAADSLSRSFESHFCITSSDLFFCFGLVACSDAMFSFNLHSRRNCIGNLQLPKERYLALRKKLMGESREYLEKHGKFHSMFACPPPSKGDLAPLPLARKAEAPFDIRPVEQAFRSATKVVLGKELGPMDRFLPLLRRRTRPIREIRTSFGGKAYCTDVLMYPYCTPSRLVNNGESAALGERRMELGAGESPGLDEMLRKISPIEFIRAEFHEGQNSNCAVGQTFYDASNIYDVYDATLAKNCAHDTMAFHAEACFGCWRAIHSKYCINCHDCHGLSACFEMDGCANCSSSMYCHNCENLDNCMFCFNAKGLRYAVGNVEVGPEKYRLLKKRVCDELVRQLEETGDVKWDVCSLGAKKKER